MTEPHDLEYDLAHEDDSPPPAEPHQPEPVQVRTETPDYGGDYGYDLAHEVPGR